MLNATEARILGEVQKDSLIAYAAIHTVERVQSIINKCEEAIKKSGFLGVASIHLTKSCALRDFYLPRVIAELEENGYSVTVVEMQSSYKITMEW